MKNLLLILIIIIFIFLLFPGVYESKSWTCRYGINYGCFASCKGLRWNNSEENNGCWFTQKNTCIGLVIGTCGANPLKSKIEFIKNIFYYYN